MIVRTYRPTDFERVLALITDAADYDHTPRLTESAFYAALLPMRTFGQFETTAVATTRDGALAGFAWWDTRRAHVMQVEGWVHPDFRRQGYGTALVTAAERYARAVLNGAHVQSRGYADIAGLRPLYERKGYAVARTFYVMSTRLEGRDLTPELPAGIQLRTFHQEHLEPLVQADNEIFADHWGSAPRSVQTWEHAMITTRPHDPGLWTIAWHGDEIVGECLCHASREGGPKDGWVSIVGVQRAWRGCGLGRALLICGLQKLRDAGYQTAALHVDAENQAAVNLYRSVEMDVIRERLHFARTVSGASTAG